MQSSARAAVEPANALVDRCVAGEQAAWRSLHQRYHQTAISVLRRMGVRPDQLQDACQEVFLDVFHYLPRFRQEADFRSWLYRICVSHARVARRRARVARLLESVLSTVRSQPAEPMLDEGQASRKLAAAMERLSHGERAAFVLFELEGLSGREVAAALGCPESTVFRRLHDARKRFSAAVEASGG